MSNCIITEPEDIACHLRDLGERPDGGDRARVVLLLRSYQVPSHEKALAETIRTMRAEATPAPKRPVSADVSAILLTAAASLERGEHHGAVARTLARYGLTP